jgi:hypothetical protein
MKKYAALELMANLSSASFERGRVQHLIIFFFRGLNDGLLEDLSDIVDGDIDLPKRRNNVIKQFLYVWIPPPQLTSYDTTIVHTSGFSHICLKHSGLPALLLNLLSRVLSSLPRSKRIIMHGDGRPRVGHLPTDQSAQILSSTGDERNFSLEWLRHDVLPERLLCNCLVRVQIERWKEGRRCYIPSRCWRGKYISAIDEAYLHT